MTVRIRVIPCLDVADGRVVKGVNFVDLKDAGDPVEQARAYDAAGADELCFLDISASHEGRGTLARHRAAHGGSLLHAADRRRRGAQRRGCARAAAGRGGQGGGQLRRGRPARSGRRNCREDGQPVRRRLGRCALEPTTIGKSSPMAGAAPTGIDAVEHAVRLAELGAGELLVTSMDGDGTQRGYDLELTRTIADAVSRAGDRQRRRRHARPSGRRRHRGPCQRGAGRLDLPFRHLFDRRCPCSAAGGGAPGAGLTGKATL